MNRGFFKSWRKEFESRIWTMPPLYHRVWHWIIGNAQHHIYEANTPTPFVIYILPGQKLTSVRQIAEGVKWQEWGKDVVPNSKTISTILEWLKQQGMIVVESNAKGTLISVVNWHIYNAEPEKKVTGGGQRFLHGSDTNKKEKKEKKEKNKPSYVGSDGVVYGHAAFFERLWKTYPVKDGKDPALRSYNATVKTAEDMVNIRNALFNYLEAVEKKDKQFIKNGSTWFNNWQDWIPEDADAA